MNTHNTHSGSAARLAAQSGAHDVPRVASFLWHAEVQDQPAALAELQRKFPDWFGAPPPPASQRVAVAGDRRTILASSPEEQRAAELVGAAGVYLRFDEVEADGLHLIGRFSGERCRADAPRLNLIQFLQRNHFAMRKTC